MEHSDVESASYDRTMTRRLLWKLDIHILPSLALLWLACFLDRANIGNAAIAGLRTDLHLQGNQFNIALTVFFILYIVSELPSNWAMKRAKPNVWLAFIVCGWGIVTTLTGLVSNFGGLVTVRLLLGGFEGGLLPGMVLYLSTIYNRHELQFRVAIFYASAALSGAFGGLLASAITQMDGVGGLAGWRWIFILEGIATVIAAGIAYFVLPENIENAKFLTEEERQFGVKRFRADNLATDRKVILRRTQSPDSTTKEKEDPSGSPAATLESPTVIEHVDEVFEWREVRRGICDIQVWLTGIAVLGLGVSLFSYSLFLPTIIAGLGYSGAQAQLHTVPPYVPAVVLVVVVSILSDKFKWRGPFILICLPIAAAGYILAISATTNTARYAAVFLMAAGVYPSAPCILSILPNNSSGHYKKATTTALQLMICNVGGFVATFAYTADQAPRYVRGHSIALSFVCLAWIMMACNVAYCLWENKARREGRRQGNIEKYQRLVESGKTKAPIGDRSPDYQFTL